MAGNREQIIEKITAIAERVAASEGMEVVNVELVGGGRNRVLRLFIDRPPKPGETVPPGKPFGVSVGDCEFISHQVGTILDLEDVIPGEHYQLEVSSPGAERKLTRPVDYERFRGHRIRVKLHEPLENQKVWRGTLAGYADGVITLEAKPGKQFAIQLPAIDRVNLEIDW